MVYDPLFVLADLFAVADQCSNSNNMIAIVTGYYFGSFHDPFGLASSQQSGFLKFNLDPRRLPPNQHGIAKTEKKHTMARRSERRPSLSLAREFSAVSLRRKTDAQNVLELAWFCVLEKTIEQNRAVMPNPTIK